MISLPTQRKLPLPKKKDVLSRRYHEELVKKVNPLQEITIWWGNKNQVHYGDSNVAFELAIPGSSGSSQSSSIAQFTVGTVGTDSFVSTTGILVAFPVGLRAAANPKGDFSKAQIVPGLKPGMQVYAENVGSGLTGISGAVWLWLNNEGMSWGILFRFKDSSNNCAPMKCFVSMTDPVPDV